MSQDRLVKVSKYLSKHLRHTPHLLGLTLYPGGWVVIEELLAACATRGFFITRSELETVVTHNDKKRFSFDPTGKLIRANQGHTVKVDLQLDTRVPPDILYHGTGAKAVNAILEEGLKKMSRHHVHLSSEIETATKVGRRHGKPVVFAVSALTMHEAGFTFYCSDNGVWLVDFVPSTYLQQL
jgi:putative RNA 2'-phosphotransferase